MYNHLVVTVLLLLQIVVASSSKSPEGEILFYEEFRQGKGNIVLLKLTKGEKRKVGHSGSRSDHFPSWSADGEKIAFESYRKGGWHIWVADADGTNARRLSNLPDYITNSYEFDPNFAPDNQSVVFVKGEDLWAVTLNNPTPKRITFKDNNIWETAPNFSPDGRQIVLAGYDQKTQERNIYTLSNNGSELTQLTSDQCHNLAPIWSPDGRHILFYSDRNGSFELYEMTREGKNVRAVFDQAQLESAGFQKTAFVDPWDNDWGATEQYRADYSPDGNWIVFSRDIEGDRELFVSKRDGSSIIRITHRPGLDGQPVWRPR